MNDAILKFRRYEDAPLAYTAPNRHASGTRIGLMDSTVPAGGSSPLGDICLLKRMPTYLR